MKLSQCRYRFGGAPRTRTICGKDVQMAGQSSKFIKKHAKEATNHHVEGDTPRPRLDRPSRASGGPVVRMGGTGPQDLISADSLQQAQQANRDASDMESRRGTGFDPDVATKRMELEDILRGRAIKGSEDR